MSITIGEVYTKMCRKYPYIVENCEDWRPLPKCRLQLWMKNGAIIHYSYILDKFEEGEDEY